MITITDFNPLIQHLPPDPQLLGVSRVSSQQDKTATISPKPQVDNIFHESTAGNGYKRTYAYKAWRTRTATALLEAGMNKEAELFNSCAETPLLKISSDQTVLNSKASTVWVCSHDNDHDASLFFGTCDLRICPDCAHRQLARFANRLIPIVSKYASGSGRNRLRHIVLTTPLDLADDDAPGRYKFYWSCVSKLWDELEKQFPKCQTKGTIESAEFGTDGHKLHFHVQHYGTYIPQDALSKVWFELTGETAQVVHVRSVGQTDGLENDVIETLKYSVKFWSRDEDYNVKYIDPELMPNLVRVLKGTRRVRTRGVFYRLPVTEKKDYCCEQCGHEMVRIGLEFWNIWQQTGWLPKEYKRIMRDNRLNLKLANKSSGSGGKPREKDPPESLEYRQKDLDWSSGRDKTTH